MKADRFFRLIIVLIVGWSAGVLCAPLVRAQQSFNSTYERDNWISKIRQDIQECERDIARQEQIVKKLQAHLQQYPGDRGSRALLDGHRDILESTKRRKAQLEQMLRNIPPVRDLEAEQRQRDALRRQQVLEQQHQQAQRQREAAERQRESREQQQRAQSNDRARVLQNGLNQAFEQQRARSEAFDQIKQRSDQARRDRRRQQRERDDQEAADRSAQEEADRAAQSYAYADTSPSREEIQQQAQARLAAQQRAEAAARWQEQENQSRLALAREGFSGLFDAVPEVTPPSISSGSASSLPDTFADFASEVSARSTDVLLEELAGQVAGGDLPDLGAAARSGLGTVVNDTLTETFGALYDSALEQMPRSWQTDVRSLGLPLAWMTGNIEHIKATYDDFIEKEIAAPLRNFSPEGGGK